MPKVIVKRVRDGLILNTYIQGDEKGCDFPASLTIYHDKSAPSVYGAEELLEDEVEFLKSFKIVKDGIATVEVVR